MKYDNLRNAPIKEALIDIRVSLPNKSELIKSKESLFSEFKKFGFDIVEDLNIIEVKGLNDKNENQPHSNRSLNGYRFRMSKGNKIIQTRINGFSFSILQPYSAWEDLESEAKEYWGIYSKIISQFDIIRLATRFINLANINEYYQNSPDISEIFTCPPTLPNSFDGSIEQSLSSYVIKNIKNKFTAIITKRYNPSQSKNNLLLDIDVFGEYVDKKLNNSQIWENLEEIRDTKNKIFFNLLNQDLIKKFK